MELRDFFVTPLVILVILMAAYFIRPFVTDDRTRRYFFLALFVKIIGALAIGFIYQFYYGSGDTFMYHTSGSRLIWETILDSPSQGFTLLFKSAGDYTEVYNAASKIYFFRDPSSFSLLKLAAVIDLLTYSTYSATATLFAGFGFVGTWALFLTFYKQYPNLHKVIALAICFIPSVFFWSSGILKETIVIGFLGLSTFQLYTLFIEKKISLGGILILVVSIYFIFMIKKFVLQAYLPAAVVWIFALKLQGIPSLVLRILLVPVVTLIVIGSSYYAVVKVGEGDDKYAINKIALTAKVTAYDIRYWSGREAGSGYELGELDGTFSSMLRLAPQAINVTLFRPYLWEVKNPLMLLSSIEGAGFLVLTILVVLHRRNRLMNSLSNPNVIFCLAFSISFAFAVGISTYNFGTLARYKTPLLPFYAMFLALAFYHEKSDKKFEELDRTE